MGEQKAQFYQETSPGCLVLPDVCGPFLVQIGLVFSTSWEVSVSKIQSYQQGPISDFFEFDNMEPRSGITLQC